MTRPDAAPSYLMTPREVADVFNVKPKTIARWANEGRFGQVGRTRGGHRRFDRLEIEELRRNGWPVDEGDQPYTATGTLAALDSVVGALLRDALTAEDAT